MTEQNTATENPPADPPAGAASPAPAEAVTPGQVAYEAYSSHRAWTAYNGTTIPQWADTIDGVREAWEVAAAAVRRGVGDELRAALPAGPPFVADPAASLPTPTGVTGDPVVAITGWFGHLVAEAERAEQTIRTWLAPAAGRGAAEAVKAIEAVIKSL